MSRRLLAAAVVLLLGPSSLPVFAQTAPAVQFRWQAGQVLLYRVEHVTEAAHGVGEVKSETRSVLKVTKRWQVTAVDADGVATMRLSLTSMLQERTTPSGD